MAQQTRAVTTTNDDDIQRDIASMMNYIKTGKIDKMSDERAAHMYVNLCESLGLNPAMRPIAIVENGIYISKAACEWYANKHNISRSVTKPEITTLESRRVIYIKAVATNGKRTEEDYYYRTIVTNDDISVQIRKALSAAKRRVTLPFISDTVPTHGMWIEDDVEEAGLPTRQFTLVDEVLSDEPVESAQPNLQATRQQVNAQHPNSAWAAHAPEPEQPPAKTKEEIKAEREKRIQDTCKKHNLSVKAFSAWYTEKNFSKDDEGIKAALDMVDTNVSVVTMIRTIEGETLDQEIAQILQDNDIKETVFGNWYAAKGIRPDLKGKRQIHQALNNPELIKELKQTSQTLTQEVVA